MNGISEDLAHEFDFVRPPLGVRHLMLWMACIGIALTITSATLAPAPRYFLVVILHSLSAGAAIPGSVLLLHPNSQHGRMAPGERLLFILGMSYLAAMFYVLGDAFLCPSLFVLLSISAWIGLAIAGGMVRVGHWRLLFFVLFALPVACFLFLALAPTRHFGLFVVAVGSLMVSVFAGTTWFDWRQPVRYPWTHWGGLLCCAWLFLALIVFVMIEWGH